MSIDDKINEALGISNTETHTTKQVIKKEFTPPVPRLEDKEKQDIDNDYKYSRENYYNLIERGQDAVQGILDIAKESQHPRAYEVAGQLIKTQSEIAQNLLDLQDKLKKIKDVKELGPKNVTNALFVGSTTELQKMIKKNKDKK